MKTYPLAKPFLTQLDRDSVNDVLTSSNLSRGPKVREFETAFKTIHKTKHASAVSSGTSGLILALQALGVGQGDEVITVSFTVPATVNSIMVLGAKPKMIDIDEESLGLCPQALKSEISEKTKAIVVVHAFGKAAKIESIISIASQYQVPVIEDACEALGNDFNHKPLGSFADLGVFGFYPNKQITTGEGGMVITNDKKLYDRIELLKNHGRSMSGEWLDQEQIGWNFRLSDLNAALGCSQCQQLNIIKEKRRRVAEEYTELLSETNGILLPQMSKHENESAWFVYVIQIQNGLRDQVFNQLKLKDIQCGKYFAPVHLQPVYSSRKMQKLPVTERIAQQSLALPFFPELTLNDIEFITNELKKALNSVEI